MSNEPHGKLTEQINFGVTAETLAAAEKIETDTGIRITHIARAGFIKELQLYRHGVHNAPVTPKEVKTIEDFKKVTGSNDITPVLAAAMRDHVEGEASASKLPAPLPVFATSVAGSAKGAAKPAGAELGTDTGRRALRNGAASAA